MVRAFSSLCGSLFLLWQHYQTCKALWIFLFHMACISSTQTHSLSFSIRIHTTHQSKPSTQSATARRLCLWLQPWLFSAGSGELSEHPSIHPFLIHLQTSFTPATLSSRLACPENLQRKVSNMDPDAPTASAGSFQTQKSSSSALSSLQMSELLTYL